LSLRSRLRSIRANSVQIVGWSSIQFGGVGDIFRDTLSSCPLLKHETREVALSRCPFFPGDRTRSKTKLDRLEEQMRRMSSRIDEMAETSESRRADDEAAAIAAERIRSGGADHKEDGAEALAQLGIDISDC
jgi:hypothetical protein